MKTGKESKGKTDDRKVKERKETKQAFRGKKEKGKERK